MSAPSHRMSKSPLYRAWSGMKYRTCERGWIQRPTYRGVHRDPRWDTFTGFMANQPAGRAFAPGLVLSRVGDTGPYTPENCRWQTKTENGREERERVMVRMPDGRFAADVAIEHGISRSTFFARRRAGWSVEDAATRPIDQAKRWRALR